MWIWGITHQWVVRHTRPPEWLETADGSGFLTSKPEAAAQDAAFHWCAEEPHVTCDATDLSILMVDYGVFANLNIFFHSLVCLTTHWWVIPIFASPAVIKTNHLLSVLVCTRSQWTLVSLDLQLISSNTNAHAIQLSLNALWPFSTLTRSLTIVFW